MCEVIVCYVCVCEVLYVKLLYVKFVSVKLLYVTFVCVKFLYVKILYVKFCMVSVREAAGGGGGTRDTESKTRNPTQRCGEQFQRSGMISGQRRAPQAPSRSLRTVYVLHEWVGPKEKQIRCNI